MLKFAIQISLYSAGVVYVKTNLPDYFDLKKPSITIYFNFNIPSITIYVSICARNRNLPKKKKKPYVKYKEIRNNNNNNGKAVMVI